MSKTDVAVPTLVLTKEVLDAGTEPMLEVTAALRGDHWLHRHPEAPAELAQAIRARMLDSSDAMHRACTAPKALGVSECGTPRPVCG